MDFVYSVPGHRSQSTKALRLPLASPARLPGRILGIFENRWRHTACPHPTRLACFLPRRLRVKRIYAPCAPTAIFGRCALALAKTSALYSLSLDLACAGTRIAGERAGTVANVVFPTAVDQRADLEQPNRLDVYYGMADSRIGVARTDVPVELPPEARTIGYLSKT